MPVSEFNALWREYVAAFGELIRPAECNAQSSAAKRMVRWHCIGSRRKRERLTFLMLHTRLQHLAVWAVQPDPPAWQALKP